MLDVKDFLSSLLDNAPIGTLIALAGIGCTLYAYITGSIDLHEAFEYLGYTSGSAAVVGVMRSHAGKGLK